MSSLVPSFRQVAEIPEGAAHDSVRKAIKFLVYSTVDLQQAIPALNDKVNAISTPSTASSTTSSGGGTVTVVTNGFPGLGGVNNQAGNTSYKTSTNDNGVMLILNDASAVAVTLNSGVTTPFFLFITNTGAGVVTITPSSGNINGASSMTLAEGYLVVAAFDGTNWWTSALLVIPANTPAVAHEWLASYNSATGAFTQTQPAVGDVSGAAPLASPALTGTPTAPTAAPLTDDTQIATTAYADAAVAVEKTRAEAAEALLAPIASPTFTGTVTQPTPSVLTGATTATSATAGSASALPATPAGYLEVSINATVFKVPYYSV